VSLERINRPHTNFLTPQYVLVSWGLANCQLAFTSLI
jgi:hypothetical protein